MRIDYINEQSIQANKGYYLNAIEPYVKDFEGFKQYLEETDFFNKPATTKYHLSVAGGMCLSSLMTLDILTELCNVLVPGKYTTEDIVKVALLKDVYRAESYEEYYRNVKDETTGKWMSVKSFKIKETDGRRNFGSYGVGAFMATRNFVDLTEEQILAIMYAEFYTEDNSSNVCSVMEGCSLVALLHMADIAAKFVPFESKQ